jgi:hypothetical protein
MVRHWQRLAGPVWRAKQTINGAGSGHHRRRDRNRDYHELPLGGVDCSGARCAIGLGVDHVHGHYLEEANELEVDHPPLLNSRSHQVRFSYIDVGWRSGNGGGLGTEGHQAGPGGSDSISEPDPGPGKRQPMRSCFDHPIEPTADVADQA